MLSRQTCHIFLLCIQTGRHCHSHLLSDRCCAGNPLRRAPACYKWAAAPRDMLRLKISPSHLTLAARTGKCVWRPLVLFLYLPVTHTAAAQAEPARHGAWLWHVCTEQQNTQGQKKKTNNTHTHTQKNAFYRFLIRADEWIHTSARRDPSAQLPGTQTNVTMNVEKTLKQNQNKQQPYSHTSLQQDVLSKTNTLVSLWSVHLFTLVALENHIARTGPLLVQSSNSC